MTATINASTTAGVVTTADTSGILQLQTNGTAALTVDASQNTTLAGTLTTTGVTTFAAGTAALPAITTTGDTNTGIFFPAADTIGFAEGGVEAARLDSSGNFGLGVTPSAWDSTVRPVLSVKASTGSFSFGASGVDNARFLANAYYSGGFKRVAAGYASQYEQNAGTHIWYTAGTSTADSAITFTEAARIDSSGNLLVGTTASVPTADGISLLASTNNFQVIVGHSSSTPSGISFVNFRYNNNSIGSITQNGTTAVAYNTSSDYRLKENIAPLTGALARVAALKPCTYAWKSAPDEIGEGFIAHELAEVVPQCVTGEKDAVQEEQYEVTPAVKDEEGNIVTEAVMGTRTVPSYQGIDTSFLVATLTAALQELKAIVDEQAVLIAAQGAEIAALKGATA